MAIKLHEISREHLPKLSSIKHLDLHEHNSSSCQFSTIHWTTKLISSIPFHFSTFSTIINHRKNVDYLEILVFVKVAKKLDEIRHLVFILLRFKGFEILKNSKTNLFWLTQRLYTWHYTKLTDELAPASF